MSAVDATPQELEKPAREHDVPVQAPVHAVLYGPFAAVLLKSHWYAPLVVDTVSQKTLPTVVIGVPTFAAGHATHDASLGMGATVFAPHTVAAVAEHDEPEGHGVHRVWPAVAM